MQNNSLQIAPYFLYLFIFILSCKGQNSLQSNLNPSNNPVSADTLGVTVTKLGKTGIIFNDSQGNYWFSDRSQGIIKYDGNQLTLYTKEDGLCSINVIAIQEDQNGNIYFDTLEGVSKFDGEKFTTLVVIESPPSGHEWQLKPGDLWFSMGWYENGPYRYDGQSLYHLEFPEPEQAAIFHAQYPHASFNPYGIYKIYEDSKGGVWFGTASLGVCRYDGQSVSWLYEEQLTSSPNGGAFGIRSILEDKDGYFWFNNTRYRYEILTENLNREGVDYINYNKENGYDYTDEQGETSFPYFFSMLEDDKGVKWMSNDELWKQKGEKLMLSPLEDIVFSNYPSTLYLDNQAVLWLITTGAGLYRCDNGTDFKKFMP